MKTLSVFLVSLLFASPLAFAEKAKSKTKAKPAVVEQDETTDEPAAAPQPTSTQSPYTQNSRDNSWRFAVGLGLMLGGGTGTFKDAKYTSATDNVSFEAELEYSKIGSLSLEGRYMPQDSWGFMGGFNLEPERKFESGTFKSGGSQASFNGSGDVSKVQFQTVFANAVYRWNIFYLPFGLNISSAKFTAAPGSNSTVTASGIMGAQLGVGWMITDSFAIELYSWVNSMKLKTTNGSETVDYGTGYFSSLRVFAKYAF